MGRSKTGKNVSRRKIPPSNWNSRSHNPHPTPSRNLALEVLGVILSSSLLLIASQGQNYRSSVFHIPVAELLQVLNWSQKLVLKTAGGGRAALDLLPREMRADQSEHIDGPRCNKSSTVVPSVNVLMRIQRLLETTVDSDEWSDDDYRMGRTTGPDRDVLKRLGKSRIMKNLFRVVQGIRTAAAYARNGFIVKALGCLHGLLSDQWVQMGTPSTVVLYCIEPLQDIIKIAVSGSAKDLVERMGRHVEEGVSSSPHKNAEVLLKKLHESVVFFCHIGFTADNPTMCKPQRHILGELHSQVQAAIRTLLGGDDLVQYDHQHLRSRRPEKITNQHQEAAVVLPAYVHVTPSSITTPTDSDLTTQRVSHAPPPPYPELRVHNKSSHQEQQDVCMAASTHPSQQQQQQQQQHSSKESVNWKKEREIGGPPSTRWMMGDHNKRQKLQQPNHQSSEYPQGLSSTSGSTMILCQQENEVAARFAVPGTQRTQEQFRQPFNLQYGNDIQQHSRSNFNGGNSSNSGDIESAPSHFPAHLSGGGANVPTLASAIPVCDKSETAAAADGGGVPLETPLQQKKAKNDGSGGLEILGTNGISTFGSRPLSDTRSVANVVDGDNLIENAAKRVVQKPKFSPTVKVVGFLPWINEIHVSSSSAAAQGQTIGTESDVGLGFENDILSTLPLRNGSEELVHHFKYRNKNKALASGCRVCEEKSRPICNHCLNCIACYNKNQMPCSATRIAGVSSSDAGEAEIFAKEGKGLSSTLTKRMDRAIHKAFTTKDFDPIFSLVRYQTDLVNFQRSTGETALHAAVFAGDEGAVKALLSLGGNPTLRDSNNNDAAAMAFVSIHGNFPELAALVSSSRSSSSTLLPHL